MAKHPDIHIKRIYEKPASSDGYRILVDRIWPRGIKKEDAQLDEWDKSLAPSSALRKWFNHQQERFDEFEKKYEAELMREKDELIRVKKIGESQKVTLLYGARDTEMNQAVVLARVLRNLRR